MGTEAQEEGLTFRVSDLKQYFFCARIVYYQTCLPAVRPTTFTMQTGSEQGRVERGREERRSLRAYGLTRGERFFDVNLHSARLRLRGRLDMAIRTDDNEAGLPEAIPVDYKLTPGRVVEHFVMQVAAYGMLLEEGWGLPARRGFLYLIPARRARLLDITEARRDAVRRAVDAMTEITLRERMPPPPRTRGKCVICEFRRFCNDVV